MASLDKLAKQLKQQKLEASKLRRRSESQLKQVVSVARKSSSGLNSLEKRLEGSKEKLGEINAEFNQILARRESLERLVKMAHERLTREVEAKDQAEIDLANAESDEAKQSASDRVAQITEKIAELESEIKQRESAAQKLVDVIEDYKKSKTQTSHQIQKQVKTKPTLITLIKKSQIDSEKLKRQVESAAKKESAVSKNLAVVTEKLEKILAKKRKAAARKAALKRAAKKRAQALARKKAAAKRKALAKKSKASKKKMAKPKKRPSAKKSKAKKKSRR